MSELWAAPTAGGPVDALVEVPGSKSETNRLLVLAAHASTPTVISRPLQARDTELMARALRALGTGVDSSQEGHTITVTPAELSGPARIDVGLAGTVMRFLPPVAALARGDVDFDGDPRARERPMSALIEAMVTLGVSVDDGGRGRLPFTVRGTGNVRGGHVTMAAASSSQFVSALLLSGCRFDCGLDLEVAGPLPSTPHVDMTVAMLDRHGVEVVPTAPASWRVEPGRPRGGTYAVAPDLSNATPFLAAAVVTGGTVRIPGWEDATTQPAAGIRGVLEAMGAATAVDDQGALVASGTGQVSGVDLDLGDLPELVTTVTALAALASGPTRIRGVAHLRGHETDRLAALSAELNGLGGDVRETQDGLEIRPRPLHGGVFHTYADHRMATAAAVLGLVVPGVLVEDVATTGKTLPGFTRLWDQMLEGRDA